VLKQANWTVYKPVNTITFNYCSSCSYNTRWNPNNSNKVPFPLDFTPLFSHFSISFLLIKSSLKITLITRTPIECHSISSSCCIIGVQSIPINQTPANSTNFFFPFRVWVIEVLLHDFHIIILSSSLHVFIMLCDHVWVWSIKLSSKDTDTGCLDRYYCHPNGGVLRKRNFPKRHKRLSKPRYLEPMVIRPQPVLFKLDEHKREKRVPASQMTENVLVQ